MTKQYCVNGTNAESVPKDDQFYSFENQDKERKIEESNYPKNDKKRQFSIEEIREKLSQKNVEAEG